MTVRGIDETDLAGALADFTTAYAAALATHLDAPVSAELKAAAQLGREARRQNISMLQLVGRHLEVRRAQVLARGTDRLVDMDRFLSAVLAAFEEASDGEPTPFAMSRDRIELLRGLSDAYLAIASGMTLDARVEEVCTQARRFFGAADARLVFGREAEDQEPHPPADVMAAHLLGSAALLTVYAVAGRRWTDGERTMLQQLAALISAPINDARRLEAAQHAAELGRLLGGVVEPVDVLARFRDEGVGLVGADRVVLVGADQANADDDACDEIPPDVRATIAAVASSGSPQYLTDRPDSSSMVWAVLPVTSGSQRFAVMVAGFDDPQPFDDVQQSFLADMTGRLGAALERSEAYANEQTARRDAEKASARWRDLQGLAADLATAATRRRVAQTLLRSVLASGHLDSGLVAMYATRPQVEVLAHSRALRSMQGELAAELVKLLSGVDGRARNGLLHYVDVADMAPELRESLAADGVTAVTGVAIMAGARQVGMLVLARRRAARGSHDEAVADVELLDAQVAMAGATLQRAARYDSEHTIADTLQRSMLELPPLTVTRLRWAVRYRAGSAGLAGGDWYDLIGLDEQRVAIVVGDVVGRGVEAAAAMGQLRSAVRALARQIERPAALVTAVSEFTASTGPGRYASLAYLVLDTHSGQLDFAIAGHPPPIVQRPDGEATQLLGALGPVLGVGCGRTEASTRVTPGSRLVVYTDGLVERRGEPLDAGIARLVAALRACPPGAKPDDVCGTLIDELVPDAAPDDIAIVAVELGGDES